MVELKKQTGPDNSLANTFNNIGSIYFLKGDDHKAYEYFNQGLILAKQVNSIKVIKNSAYSLYRLFKKQNKYDEALEMYELAFKMRDSIYNNENSEAVTKQQFKYEYEKKEIQLKEEQEKKDIVAAANSRRQKIIIVIVGIGFLFLLIFAIMIYKINSQRKKLNFDLAQKNAVIEEKQKEIIDSIVYAKRIQTALLPTDSYVARTLNKLNNKS